MYHPVPKSGVKTVTVLRKLSKSFHPAFRSKRINPDTYRLVQQPRGGILA
jgi:hypothetical protein